MSKEYQHVAHKSREEVARDMRNFLSRTCIIQGKKQVDLADLLPNLTMREQLAFAFLMEAREQRLENSDTEEIFRSVFTPALGATRTEKLLHIVKNPSGEDFPALQARYGCDFSLASPSYWSACLSVAIDANAICAMMEYLRAFVFCILEFAYMEDQNPTQTYVWRYYASFERILNELSTPAEPLQPISVCALGGTVGKRDAEGYLLSLGLELKNTDQAHMAWGVQLEITLFDRYEKPIDVIKDHICCIDPASSFHYGITRRIKGPAVARFSATAKAQAHTRLSTPILQHVKLFDVKMKRIAEGCSIQGRLHNGYDRDLSALTLHYHLLSAENKILGGGKETVSKEFPSNTEKTVSWILPLSVKNASKILYSVELDAQELI